MEGSREGWMRVVVVGAGVFGTWTAHYLARGGADVTLVDAYGPGHSRSSSGDETRVVRCGYGPDAIYSEMARRSLAGWQELAARAGAGEPLWHPCGVLWMAAGDDPYTRHTYETLRAGGYPVERLAAAAVRDRFPVFDTEGLEMALHEPTCGVVLARRSVRALAHELQRGGVRLVRARVRPVEAGVVRSVQTDDGRRLEADAFVFACGAWLPGLFAALQGRIRPTRQVVVYFGTPAGDARFEPDRFPAWIDFPAGIYGTPDIGGRGVKVGIDRHGPPLDPDTVDRLADDESLAMARAWLARRVPALARAPIVETRVCQYENTATGDFLIDRLPGHEHVWVAGGGSGHGFKHGPAVGEHAAHMVLTGAAPHPRFAFAGKTTSASRQVY